MWELANSASLLSLDRSGRFIGVTGSSQSVPLLQTKSTNPRRTCPVASKLSHLGGACIRSIREQADCSIKTANVQNVMEWQMAYFGYRNFSVTPPRRPCRTPLRASPLGGLVESFSTIPEIETIYRIYNASHLLFKLADTMVSTRLGTLNKKRLLGYVKATSSLPS